MASTLQDQEEGKSTSNSTRMTDEEDTGTGILSSCEQALRNDLILEKICGFLPLSDLKTCRLVNRQWKRASQDTCVQKCRAIGFFRENVIILLGLTTEHRIRRIPELIQVINTSGDAFPCKSFVVECGIVDSPESEAIVVSLLSAIAPIAESLWLMQLDKKLFRDDSYPNLQFPRLKSLKLWEDPGSISPDAIASNLNFCRDIIQHSPKLEMLELTFNHSNTANLFIDGLESVQEQKIRRLHLWGPLNDTHFNRLATIGLNLHCLWLCFLRESILTEEQNSLNNFLSSQSSTLEVLHLRSIDPIEELRIGFPPMKKLRQLRFQICLGSGIGLSRISYAEQFPVLQSLLIVEFPEWHLDPLFDFRIGPVDTVTSLELPEDLENPALIWQAARIFPNVKKLVVPSCAVVVMAVYEAWQQVEQLKIKMVWDGDSADQVLTTYARENQDLFLLQLDEENFQPVEFLHNLKVLRMKYDQDHSITDHGCRLVLLKLRSLRCLDLSESSKEMISEEVLQEMREKFTVLV